MQKTHFQSIIVYLEYEPGLCFSDMSLAGSRRATPSGHTWDLSSLSPGLSSLPSYREMGVGIRNTYNTETRIRGNN